MSRAEEIIRGFNERTAGSDFTRVFTQIREAQAADPNFWRREGQAINDAVDFRRLGFPSDFQVVGLSSRNQLITTEGEQPGQAQLRSASRLRQSGSVANPGEGDLWGNQNRRFRVDESGNARYTVRFDDNLSHIARDVFSHNNGRVPTQQEIARTVAEIARANGIGPNSIIRQGQELQIPSALRRQTPEAAAPARPGQRPSEAARPAVPAPTPEAGALIRPAEQVLRPRPEDAVRPEDHARPTEAPRPSATAAQLDPLRPRDGAYSPIAPAGQVLEGHRAAAPMSERQVGETEIRPGGRDHVTEVRRMVVETVPRETPGADRGAVTATSSVLRNTVTGNVLHREIRYDAPVNMSFDDGRGGSILINNVREIHTRYVPAQGGQPAHYQAVVWTGDRTPYRFTTDERGAVQVAPQQPRR
ncbi:MAG: LysM peptidoglycan-binding domain-containing protein [Candidatus Melainabacteria bacterium]|jgi:hypothetical protein|nr:LysM peptidoglycan-binding domain-containing protein [Candidatus Melainabacteria bacterium]